MQARGLELCLPNETIRAIEGDIDMVKDESNARGDTVASRRDRMRSLLLFPPRCAFDVWQCVAVCCSML